MALIAPRPLRLANGVAGWMRSAEVADAARCLAHLARVGGETENVPFAPDEVGITRPEEEDAIRRLSDAGNGLFVLAGVGDELAGMLTCSGPTRPRLRHNAEFGISVIRPWWHVGIGRALLTVMVDWAEGSGVVRKLNLIVRADNARAIRLYETFGFRIEGQLVRSQRTEDGFVDSLAMGRLVDPPGAG
jgi:RimJ/RimL family protein N-acetyltransferase